MKCIVWVLVTLSLIVCGCGGGSSSDGTSATSQSSSSGSQNLSPPDSSSNQSNPSALDMSIVINPLLDLGLSKGERVCFRIKAYNNVTESDFSGAICSILKNEEALNLSWNDVSGDVVGYMVYYGTNKKNTNNFLKDVIES